MISAMDAKLITIGVVMQRFNEGREQAQKCLKYVDTGIQQNANDGYYSIQIYPLRWFNGTTDEAKEGFIRELDETLTKLKYKVTFTKSTGEMEIKWG